MVVLLDAARLLTFVHTAHDHARSTTVQAVYAGLETRITRGDFNVEDTAHDFGTSAERKTAPESAPTLHRDLDNHLITRRPS